MSSAAGLQVRRQVVLHHRIRVGVALHVAIDVDNLRRERRFPILVEALPELLALAVLDGLILFLLLRDGKLQASPRESIGTLISLVKYPLQGMLTVALSLHQIRVAVLRPVVDAIDPPPGEFNLGQGASEVGNRCPEWLHLRVVYNSVDALLPDLF